MTQPEAQLCLPWSYCPNKAQFCDQQQDYCGPDKVVADCETVTKTEKVSKKPDFQKQSFQTGSSAKVQSTLPKIDKDLSSDQSDDEEQFDKEEYFRNELAPRQDEQSKVEHSLNKGKSKREKPLPESALKEASGDIHATWRFVLLLLLAVFGKLHPLKFSKLITTF